MELITSKQQLDEVVSELSSQKLNDTSIINAIKDQSLIIQAVILFNLELTEEAVSKISEAREQSGIDYFDSIMTFLDENNKKLFFLKTPEEYIVLKNSLNPELSAIASEYISPDLINLSSEEKYQILTSIIKDEIKCDYRDQVFDMPSGQIEIFTDLNISPVIGDDKTKMAMEYAIDPICLILDLAQDKIVWKLESKIVKSIEKFWDSVTSMIQNLSKNTIGNPTFRKYAIAGIALGVAVAGADAFAGSEQLVTDYDLGSVKDYFGQMDEHFNEVLPQRNFTGCNVSSTVISEGPDHVTGRVIVGDKMFLYNIKSSIVSGGGSSASIGGMHAEPHQIVDATASKTCNMSKSEYIKFFQIIKSQLNNLRVGK